MEEIDLRDFFELIKKSYLMIIISIILFCVGGFLFLKFINIPKYKSTASIVLTSNSGVNETITTSDVTINKNLIQTYSEIVKSRKVIENVINKLGMRISYEDMVKNIEVSSLSNTEIIKISVSNVDPETASTITNEVAETFTNEVSDIYKVANVRILDRANVPAEPYNVNYIKTEVIMFALGTLVSVFIIFLMYYFDNTIKSAEQVEARLGLPILGRIPLSKEKNGGK